MIEHKFNELRSATGFGGGARIIMPDNMTPVELVKFNMEGQDHEHEEWEHAICLQGSCDIIVNSVTHTARFNTPLVIAPGTRHRMKPVTEDPSFWIIWYTKEKY